MDSNIPYHIGEVESNQPMGGIGEEKRPLRTIKESDKMHIRRKPIPVESALSAGLQTQGTVPDFNTQPAELQKSVLHSPPPYAIPDELQQRMGALYVNQVPPEIQTLPSPISPVYNIHAFSQDPAFQEPMFQDRELVSSPDFDSSISMNESCFSGTTPAPTADDFFNESFTEADERKLASRVKTGSTGSTFSTASNTSSQQSTWSERSEKVRAKMSSGLDETSIFLGGLIRKPVESRRHYTILRHAHGLVYYKGPETAVAITIFADRPLPPDRRLWFQMKGWTGNVGMATKALVRSNGSWINVTPDRQVVPKDLPALDERAWQRDIYKFQKRAPKQLRSHVVRETAIIRIPAECTDGYFRVVLTGIDSRSVLCPSPVFRIASTSMSASSFKGASLKTLPLELAVKVAQVAATTVATSASAPYTAAAQATINSAVPASKYAGSAKTAYEAVGVQGKLESAVGRAQSRKADEMEKIRSEGQGTTHDPLSRPLLVGNDTGPEMPFPLRLAGKISMGTGRGREAFGIPTANLDDIAPDRMTQLNYGTYFGYAKTIPNKKDDIEMELDWQHAIISVIRDPRNKGSIAQRKVLRVYLIYSFPPDFTFVNSTLELLLLGWLRPLLPENDSQTIFRETIQDIHIVGASLEREAWCLDNILLRVRSQSDSETLFDKVVNVKSAGQRQLDRIPIHKLGVRNGSMASHDRGLYGNGGVYVKRD